MATRTARRVLLGREIEHMIRQAGVSQAEAGRLIEVGQSRINSLLTGAGTISAGDLKELAKGLGATDDSYIETLLELRRDNHKRGFWTTGYRRAYIDELRLLVDLEELADRLRIAEAEIIPGLLQCEAYVRALHEPQDPREDEPDLATTEDSVQARLARQQNLLKRNPAELHAILSESSLRRHYGGVEVMLEQIAHLIEMSRRSNILIQVLPFTSLAPGAGMEDRYTLIRVPSPGVAGDLEMAISESQGDIRYIDDKRAVSSRETVFTRLSAAALGADASREFMEHVARTIRLRASTSR
ncbi:helix-turn-helix domain-containing protein [Nocardia brasiliensis]|uniref:helix-turn-helix domain-containing protein n=1 Tax=Nocardia brasiliensis TaxID=37326 RepID=UPI0024548B4E|nr:helix-turn-helix transcriptional regulator [Nocardia brasiliensis]